MFTDLEFDKINELKDKDINYLKIILANQATTMLHGSVASKKAAESAKNIFIKGLVGDDLKTIKIDKIIIEKGISIIDLVIKSNLLNSRSEVRRTIKNKGIKINNIAIEDEKSIVTLNNFGTEDYIKLSHGKKNHVIVKFN